MNIAITGSGIVSAIGLDKASVLRSLREERTGIGGMHYLKSVHTELPVGEVKMSNDEMQQRLGIATTPIPRQEALETSRTVLMGMLALEQALEEARIPQEEPLRVVLISGTTVGGMDITENHYAQLKQGRDLEYIRQHDCGSSTQLMADHFGIFTDVVTISTACSSAANAMVLGAEMLKNGEADIVVAGGTEALSRFHLNGFHSLMILDKEICRPFDANRAGLNLGEGAAFVVMESETMAKKRGAVIQGYLAGYGNRCDAFHQTASSENGEGATLAMQAALAMAGLQPSDIDYVNAHGTGTPDNDRSESAALRRVFDKKMPPVSSTKGFTGHTTSASGSIETVICLLAMNNGFIPANLNIRTHMPDGIVPTDGEQVVVLDHVLCNSFGFGGNDTSLLLSRNPSQTAGAETASRGIKILSKVEIIDESSLADIRRYVKPLEARRMGKLLKATLLSSLQALEEAGVEQPDAIVTGTAYGCLENSERLLDQLLEEGEEATVKPTYFMQSTHNTLSSAIAIKTRCHGYNITYTQGDRSLEWALKDARRLIQSGQAHTVLVGCHDESTPSFASLMEKATGQRPQAIHSVAIVLQGVSQCQSHADSMSVLYQ